MKWTSLEHRSGPELEDWPIPNFLSSRVLGWRASCISDPIERLRYLRASQAAGRPLLSARPHPRVRLVFQLALLILLGTQTLSNSGYIFPSGPPAARVSPETAARMRSVWLAEKTADAELYNNGLRVERRFTTAGEKRSYQAFPRDLDVSKVEWRSQPAGIVFHLSESGFAPMEPASSRAIRREGRGLLDYVSRNRLYNYVIDRFGRVYRILEDSDRADHAGQSIWADDHWVYVNLNNSFLGVSFEARTGPGDDTLPINPAQAHAGRVLTEMLRSLYQLPASNCVTHAQVSVNPSNFRVGYHTDWGGNFPFREMGLTDNYDLPLPSLYLFGFGYDPAYLESAGQPLRGGLQRSEELLNREASARKMTVARYLSELRRRYREIKALVPTPQARS